MIRFCTNICLLVVISLLFGVIWQGSACAAMPAIQSLGQITDGLQNPSRVALDAAGNLYVANTGSHHIVKFDKYGTRVATFSDVDISGFGLAVTADGNTIYVSAGDKVAVLDTNGALLRYLGAGSGEFQAAGVITLGINGEVLVADMTTRQIKVFPVGGTAFLLNGINFGAINSIALDPASGDIYVADAIFEGTRTPQINVFGSDFVLKRQLDAGTAFGSSRLENFGGMAFDETGRFYVEDAESGNIRVLQLPATFLGLYNNNGQKIYRSNSIAYDALTKRLFVTALDSRVDVYGVNGGVTPIKSNAVPSVPAPQTVGEVSSVNPELLFTNSTDADHDALKYRVRVLDAANTSVTSFSVDEGAAGQTTTRVADALSENISYTWQVQARDDVDSSAWSTPLSIYVNAQQEAPTAPALTSFVNGEVFTSDAILTWSASTDADPFSSIHYRVEISAAGSGVTSATFTATNAAAGSVSAALTPGMTYGWKVVAVDNTGLETVSSNSGSFVYQTSVLNISANVVGAKVYLGGHYGYAGRYVGSAPLAIRDLAAGNYSIVVEAAGFEPAVQTVQVVKDASTSVAAQLKGTRLATNFALHDLHLNGQPVAQDATQTPIVADLDQDGVPDLLLASNGYLDLYPGSLALDPQAVDTIEDLSDAPLKGTKASLERVVFSSTPQRLALPQTAGASPCLVDWNNDDRFDLLIGGDDGTVKLFLGQEDGSFSVPGELLETVYVQAGAQAIPAVADVNSDGAKDLVVATGSELLLFVNSGTDAQPLLNSQTVMTALQAPAVPFFADWDADGVRELMLLSQGVLYRAVMTGDTVSSLVPTGLSVPHARSAFALDFADSHYNSLVFTMTGGGSLVVANGEQGGLSPAYKDGVSTQLSTVEQLVLDQAPELIGSVAKITSRIGRGQYAPAKKKAELLLNQLSQISSAGDAGTAVSVLIGLL